MNNIYDSIIIGASAAGISSAIYLKRRGINFLILAKDIGGEMALSGIVDNYPGIPKTTGLELTKKFKEHLESYGIEVINEEAIKLDKNNDLFVISTNKNNTYYSKTVIIATGSKPKKLNIPGEEEFYHKGVSYCSVCDMPLFKDKVVAIIGGGNSALEAGLMAADICKYAYIINKNPSFKGDKVLIEQLERKENIKIIYNALTQEIYGDKFVKGIKYLDTVSNTIQDINVDGVFIHIGMKPNSEFIPDSWNVKNTYGEIIINKLCETNVTGLFAGGDVTDIPFKQIGIAVGHGIICALSTVNYLNKLKI
jgi:NADH-dependent peroxiredoxin subunit F